MTRRAPAPGVVVDYDPAWPATYADLKRSLAARLGHDRVAYTEAKSAFIERVLEARR